VPVFLCASGKTGNLAIYSGQLLEGALENISRDKASRVSVGEKFQSIVTDCSNLTQKPRSLQYSYDAGN
jgi:hypothetical protein